MEQTVTTSNTKGIVIALILIILALATYFLNMNTNSSLQYISYLIFIGGIIWSVNMYGKQIDHNSTFGNYFAHGFKVAAVVTVIMIIYVVIFLYLFPDVKEKAVDAARKNMESKGQLTQDQINTGLNITRKFFMAFAIGGTLLGYLIFGAIAALIGAGITKKNPRPIEIDR
ncbi:MAG: DUF4199 domain-containing protein [Ginsengibacter sp.]